MAKASYKAGYKPGKGTSKKGYANGGRVRKKQHVHPTTVRRRQAHAKAKVADRKDDDISREQRYEGKKKNTFNKLRNARHDYHEAVTTGRTAAPKRKVSQRRIKKALKGKK